MKVDLNEGLKRVRYVVYVIILCIAAAFVVDGWHDHRYYLNLETFGPSDSWHITYTDCNSDSSFSSLRSFLYNPDQPLVNIETGDLSEVGSRVNVPKKLEKLVDYISTCYRADYKGVVPYKLIDDKYLDVHPVVRYMRTRDQNFTLSDAETKSIIKTVTPYVITNYVNATGLALFWSLIVIGIIEATSWIIGWVVRGFARKTET